MKTYLYIVAFITALVACGGSKKAMTNHSLLDTQGHRGARGLMPENTIPAMLKAIDLGVVTLEMDLQISGDKQVVVSHDPNFNEKITTTPEGKTLTRTEAATRLLYQMPYDSIRKYDVGMKPHPDFPAQQKLATYKPLLKQLIADAEAYAKTKGKTMRYNIEIKSSAAGDHKKHPGVEEFVDLAMDVINKEGIATRTTIQSFDVRALRVMARKYPSITTSLLIEGNDKGTPEDHLKQLGFVPRVYSPHFSLVSAALVKACHDKKMQVVPWTVNSLDEMKKLVGLGVDGIISDYPNLFQEL